MPPDLSVVLVIDQRRQRGSGALASLLAQSDIDRMEIELLDLCSRETPAIEGSSHPCVRLHRDVTASTYGEALEVGVSRSRAPIVAFLEEHARACPGWARMLIEAHAGEYAGVGCVVHTALPKNRISAAMSLINDRAWLPGCAGGEAATIRGHNASYKREALEALRENLSYWLEFEPLMQDQLRQLGFRLYVEPRAQIIHFNDSTLRSMVNVYLVWNRAFGPARAAYGKWGTIEKLARVLALPVLPFLRTLRLARNLRGQTEHLRRMIALAPEVLTANGCAALGQSVGLLAGPGNGLSRFRDHELNASREVVPVETGCE